MFHHACTTPRWLLLALLSLMLAQPASAKSELTTLDEVREGSLLIRSSEAGRYQKAPLQETDADIRVSGPVARTVLRQRFTNPGDEWAEALYAFPLPQDAAVDHMRLRIGDRIVEGDIQERQQARRTYDAARKAGKRTALVEQQRPNLFTTAVANIPPRGEVSVEIEYQQSLHWRDEVFSLRFPMAMTPRYRPAPMSRMEQTVQLAGGWSVLPGEIPNAVEMESPHSKDEYPVRNPVRLSVEINSGFALERIESRYHEVDIHSEAGVQYVNLREDSAPAEHDFELVWQPAKTSAPQAAFFTQRTGAGNYGLLMLMPPRQAFINQAPLRREVIYVVDSSGSMSGKSMREAKRALSTALSGMHSGDYFNVIDFDSTARPLFPAPNPVDLHSRTRALEFVDQLAAEGGTEILGALRLALAQGESRPGYLRQIVFITDGAVSNEQDIFRTIHQELGNARLFTVGIGSAPNSHFMVEAAGMGRGSFTYIGDLAEVEQKMAALFQRIEHPALTDIRLALPVEADSLPDPIPDLYLGEPLSVVMKLDALPDGAHVQGQVGDIDWNTGISLGQSRNQTGLDVLWARSKIGWWQREQVRGTQEPVVRRAITELALTHHLVSRYTSLVAVDKTPVRPADAALDAHALRSSRPRGWAPPSGHTVPMANGSTTSLASLLLGLPVLLVSLLCKRLLSHRSRK